MKYYFYVEGSGPLSLWAEFLSRKALVRDWSKKVNPMGVYSHFGHGIGVVVELQHLLQYNKYRQTVERLFQLKPTMKAIFHSDEPATTSGGEFTGTTAMVQMVAGILALESGGSILLNADHDIILRKREGLLLLNADSGFWTPSRLAHILLPYELRRLPTPLRE